MKQTFKLSIIFFIITICFGCKKEVESTPDNQTSNSDTLSTKENTTPTTHGGTIGTKTNVQTPSTPTSNVSTEAMLAVPEEMYAAGPIVYRSNNGANFLFSLSETEGPKAGYWPDEARFGTLASGTGGTTPLFRCLSVGYNPSHFLSVGSTCEGHTNEGSLGNISTTPKLGLVPLVRWVHLKSSIHIAVIPSEKIDFKGWKEEGVLGYVTELKIPAVVKTPDDGKKYFGFYAGAMDYVGTGDYISELTTKSNLIFISSTTNLQSKLADCEKRGIKAIVTFDKYFLDAKFHLRTDYKESFKSVQPIVERYKSTIAAFYGLDEPYYNSEMRGLGEVEVYHAQETMGRYLKSKFPNIPIGVIFTTDEVKKGKRLFPSFDWFGFDCYDEEMECGGKSVDWYFEKLSTAMKDATLKDGKKRYMMAIPQAGYDVSAGPSKGEKSILAQIPGYRKIVKNNSNIKVVMPFIWQTFNDGTSSWVGAREIPKVKEQYLLFYQDFMKGAL